MTNILISGNAGQGKTTIAVNLAVALAQFGHHIQIVNADMHTPKIHYHFGLTPFRGTYRRAGLDVVMGTPDPHKQQLVDVPANALHRHTGRTILVTRADFPSIYETLKLIKKGNVEGLIVNDYEQEHYEMSIANIQEFTDRPVLGVIPRDTHFNHALKHGHPHIELSPERTSTIQLKRIAANLINEHYTIMHE